MSEYILFKGIVFEGVWVWRAITLCVQYYVCCFLISNVYSMYKLRMLFSKFLFSYMAYFDMCMKYCNLESIRR